MEQALRNGQKNKLDDRQKERERARVGLLKSNLYSKAKSERGNSLEEDKNSLNKM